MIVYRKFGRRVVDSRTSITVHVQAQDIEQAVCRDHQKCVIARALMRRAGVKWVDVSASVVLVAKAVGTTLRYYLSSLGKRQVRWFDTHDGAFAPCTVELQPTPAWKVMDRSKSVERAKKRAKYKHSPKRQPSTR